MVESHQRRKLCEEKMKRFSGLCGNGHVLSTYMGEEMNENKGSLWKASILALNFWVDRRLGRSDYRDMDPNEQNAGPANQPVPHQFPPGLEFLSAFRKSLQLEGEEKIALLFTLLDNIRDFSDRLRQAGLDPDRMIETLEGPLNVYVQAEKKVQKEQDRLLHAAADAAEATCELVNSMEEAVNAAAEEKPFDPQVQEWKEEIEEIRKQYPRMD
jgi:hypothetical protein